MKTVLLTLAAIYTVTALFILSVSSAFVSAEEYSKGATQSWSDKDSEHMSMGTHSMTGTIETINNQTGWMKIKTGIGELTIHYPAPTVKELKQGDKITVHLSYTKEGDKMKDDGMKDHDKM